MLFLVQWTVVLVLRLLYCMYVWTQRFSHVATSPIWGHMEADCPVSHLPPGRPGRCCGQLHEVWCSAHGTPVKGTVPVCRAMPATTPHSPYLPPPLQPLRNALVRVHWSEDTSAGAINLAKLTAKRLSQPIWICINHCVLKQKQSEPKRGSKFKFLV